MKESAKGRFFEEKNRPRADSLKKKKNLTIVGKKYQENIYVFLFLGILFKQFFWDILTTDNYIFQNVFFSV